MTPERLAEIEARANAATQGPWEWHPYMGSGATLAKPNHPFHELNILNVPPGYYCPICGRTSDNEED